MDKLSISLLYVEDEESIRENMVASLKRRVETLYSAENGKEGLALFKEFRPDLVITDIKMPIMNGLEMIKKIRAINSDTKIIMLSAHSDTKSLLEAIDIGVNGYILKPFQTKKLYGLLSDLANGIILDKTVTKQSARIEELYNSLVKDLDTARSVQEYLLPEKLIIERDIFFSSTYVPSTKVGGDLYDIIKLSDGKYITYIGDISGHGVKAALLMTAVKSTINRIIEDEGLEEPYEIVNRLNNILSRELFSTDYMTLIVCQIDCKRKTLRFINAGHPPLIIWNNKTEEITSVIPEGSIPVGWMPDYMYTPDEEYETEFNPEHLFFLYTDGLFECENKSGEELGLNGLTEFIRESMSKYPKVVAPQKIRKALEDNHYDISSDDFTLVAFGFIPELADQNDGLTFVGYLINEEQLLVNNTSEYILEKSGNQELSKAVKEYLGSWLEENAILVENDDKDNLYLAELFQVDDLTVRLSIWSQLLDVKGRILSNGDSQVIEYDRFTISFRYDDFDDFGELIIKIKGK